MNVTSPAVTLVWVDREGRKQPAVPRAGNYVYAKVAPDGERIAVGILANGLVNLWVYESGRDLFTQITNHQSSVYSPTWSGDGRELYYTVERPIYDLFRRSSDAARPEQPLLESRADKIPSAVTPDGRELLFQMTLDMGNQLAIMRLDGSGRRVMAAAFDPATGAVGRPQPLFAWDNFIVFDATDDGERFLLADTEGAPAPHVVVVTNWLAEVRKKFE